MIAASGGREIIQQMIAVCEAKAAAGASIRVFFRDESIPAICRPPVCQRLGAEPDPATDRALAALKAAGDVRLYACSSSLYLWGLSPADLISPLDGARGLIAFLADDVAGAGQVLSY